MRKRNRRSRDRNVFVNLLALLLCSGLAGVIVAALVFPVVAMGGLTATAAPTPSTDLPTDVRRAARRRRSATRYASDGTTLLALFYDENRHDVPITEVADVDAAGGGGVRGRPVLRAQRRRHEGHRPRVRQQPARRRHAGRVDADDAATSDRSSRTRRRRRSRSSRPPRTPPDRKLAEIKRALALEKKLTKERDPRAVPEHRLVRQRRVRHLRREPGLLRQDAGRSHARRGGTARRRCRRRPARTTSADPKTGLPAALARRDNYVLPQMVELGYITQQQADEVKAAGAPKIVGKRTPEGCTAGAAAAS